MFMPVGGEVVEINPALENSPDLVNKDPYGKGWMITIRMSDPSEVNTMLTPEEYKALL
jgi:glycine cleavage system H protein